MRALRSIVAGFWILLFALVAASPAPAQRLDNALPSSWNIGSQIGPHGYAPVAQADFTTTSTLPSWLTLSVAGLATMTDSSGHLTYRPNNLLTYSNTFDNAAWVKTSATVTSGVRDPLGGTKAFTITATSANGYIQQVLTDASAASKKAIISIWLRRNAGSGAVKIYNPSAVSATTVALTSSWQQFYLVGYGNADGHFYATPVYITTSGDAVDVYASTLSAVTYETSPRAADQVITTASAYYGPRIDYDPNTLAVKGLLIEEARTNLVVNSNQFTSWTISGGSSVVTNSNTQIDGTTNGNTFSLVAGSTGHQIYKSYTGTAAAYTNSVYAKAGTSSWLGMWFASTAQADGAFFNLSNGTIGTIAAGTTAAIQSIGNGWYRCSITKTLTAATYYNGLEVHTADNQAYNFSAAGTESLYLFGAQAELGSFATSYIPTAASSVTRAADVVQFTGAALTALQGSAGAVIVQSKGFGLSWSRARIISTTSDSPLNVVLTGTSVTVDTYNAAIQILNSGSSVDPTLTARYGVTWSASGRSIAANGGVVGTDANQMHGGLTTQAWLGSQVGSSAWASGWYQSFAIYNQRLSDATLQSKSVVGAPF